MKQHLEVERTYSPERLQQPPDLTGLTGVHRLGEAAVVTLRATYFDTGDLALVRAGVTLRRRTGGSDEGWHAKLPAPRGRLEIQLPLGDGREQPPPQLADAVRGWTRGRPLAPIATIVTRRTERALLAADGTVLAELADDEVTGVPADGGEHVAWREWELELVEGPTGLLEEADRLMAGAGVSPSVVDRKILRVLGDRVPPTPPVPAVGPSEPAGAVLQQRLADLVGELRRHEAEIRTTDFVEGVHQSRIACRRLRSALAVGRPLLDRSVTDPVRDELRWFGQQLSEARDARVVGELVRALLADQPAGLVWGPVPDRVAATYGQMGRLEADHVREVLSSARHDRLLETLDRLATDAPWSDDAARRSDEVLPVPLRKEWKRLRSRVEAIDTAPDHDLATHAARKAAKRLRYALEVVEPVWPHEAKRLRTAVKRLTTVLGERQDTVVTRQHLVRLAADASAAGESTFTYGRMHGLAAARAERLDTAFAVEWKRTRRKKLRTWLR